MFTPDDQCRIFGVTTVENLFFSEYLPSAEGDFVKVYLSCLYHSQLHDEGFGIKEMAAELTMDETRVEAALRYWERRRVLSRHSDDPPRYRLHHLGQRMLTGQDSLGGDRAYINFSEAIYALFAERRKIRPNEIATAYEWVQEMGLPQSIVLMLLSHCIATRGIGFTFKYAEKIAVSLKEENITTEEDAEKYFNHNKQTRDGAMAVLRRFGLRRAPTDDEMALYSKWTDVFHFSHGDIQDACAETVKASNPSFAYLNGILEGLHRRRGSSAPVRQQLQSENDLMAATREVLDILGVRVNPVAVQGAYQALLSKFPHGMILLAAKAVQRRQGKFEDLTYVLETWQNNGLDTEDKVRAFVEKREAILPTVKTILDASGQEGSASDRDIAFVEKWLQQFSPELIEHAALQARSARQKMPYIDKVLKSWQQKGITTKAQAENETPSTDKRPAREVGAHRYAQREYTEQQLETGTDDLIKEALKNRES